MVMDKQQIRARIEEIGIIPALRFSCAEDALFAAGALCASGIPIVEVTMTVPNALEVISHLAQNRPDLIAGAGTVLDVETARQCVDAGASFLTTPGLDIDVVHFAVERGIVVFPGALTPTEVVAAWKARPDFIKIFPCSQVGGPAYLKALRGPFPTLPFIASGGVNQNTAAEFILAGAVALGIGGELVPHAAIRLREEHWIGELARRFLGMVKIARNQRAAPGEPGKG